MTTQLQQFFKNSLYKSLEPKQLKSDNFNLNKLRHSIVTSAQNIKSNQEKLDNNVTYRYERVDNMFKLVEVKSMNSDPKEQVINEDNKLDKINDAIHDLTNRIISLQFQQAKIPGLEKKLNEKLNSHQQIENQCNYLSNRMTSVSRQINQIRERLEEIQEIGSSQERKFMQTSKLMSNMRQQQARINKNNDSKYDEMMGNIKQQISQQLQKAKSTLSEPSKIPNKIIKGLDQKPLNQIAKLNNLIQFRQKGGMKLKYRQSYEYQQSVYTVNEVNYVVDREGRLLDSSGYILLDGHNKEIKLNESHFKKLRDYGLLF